MQELTTKQKNAELAYFEQTSKRLLKSSFNNGKFKTVEDLMAVCLFGRELGWAPMTSLRNLFLVNGKPEITSHGLWQVVLESKDLTFLKMQTNNEKCSIQLKRKLSSGAEIEFEETFSIDDAKKAGLLKNGSVWEKYPKRMLEARCKSVIARNAFPEKLGGFYYQGELLNDAHDDMQRIENIKVVDDENLTQEERDVRYLKDHLNNEYSDMLEQKNSSMQKAFLDFVKEAEIEKEKYNTVATLKTFEVYLKKQIEKLDEVA